MKYLEKLQKMLGFALEKLQTCEEQGYITKNPSQNVRGFISGADGARTHDLGRDRPAF